MTNGINHRLAVLETRQGNIVERLTQVEKELTNLDDNVKQILVSVSIFRWIIGIAIALGPTAGVLIAKVIS